MEFFTDIYGSEFSYEATMMNISQIIYLSEESVESFFDNH